GAGRRRVHRRSDGRTGVRSRARWLSPSPVLLPSRVQLLRHRCLLRRAVRLLALLRYVAVQPAAGVLPGTGLRALSAPGEQHALAVAAFSPDAERGGVSDRTLRAAWRRHHGAVPLGVDPEAPHGSARGAVLARAADVGGAGTNASLPAVPLDGRAGNRSLHPPRDCLSGSVPRQGESRPALLISTARGRA